MAEQKNGQQEKKGTLAGLPIVVWILGGGCLTMCFLMFFALIVLGAIVGESQTSGGGGTSIEEINARKLGLQKNKHSPDYKAGYHAGYSWLEASGKELAEDVRKTEGSYEGPGQIMTPAEHREYRITNIRYRLNDGEAKDAAEFHGIKNNREWEQGYEDGAMDAIQAIPNKFKRD